MRKYKEYKSSSSSFDRKIPKHWDEYKISWLFDFRNDKNHVEEELLSVYLDRGVVSYSSTSQKQVHKPSEDLSNYQLVMPGDFVLNNQQAWRGSVGVSKYRGIISPAYYVLKPRIDINPYFLNYAGRDKAVVDQFVIASKGVGSIQRQIYIPYLKNVVIQVPPKEEQDQIVRYLDWKVSEMNHFIHEKKKQIKKYEELKKTIINRVVFSGIRFDEKTENDHSWIPPIPKHWQLLKAKCLFAEVVDTGYGNELPLLSITNKDGVILQSETGRKKRMSEDPSSYKRIKPGDIGYNLMNAFIGSLGVSKYDGLISPAYAVCRPIVKLCPEYFEFLYRTPQYLQEFDNNSYGIMIERNRLYFDNFKQIVTVVPPYEEQVEIVNSLINKLSKIDSLVEGIKREIALVEELRIKTIADVVTGQVDVRNVIIPEYTTDDGTDDDFDSNDIDDDSEESDVDEE